MAQAVCVPLAVVRGQKRGHAPVAKARPRLLLTTDPQQRPLGAILRCDSRLRCARLGRVGEGARRDLQREVDAVVALRQGSLGDDVDVLAEELGHRGGGDPATRLREGKRQ